MGEVNRWVGVAGKEQQSFVNFTAMRFVRQFQEDSLDKPRGSLQRRLTVVDHAVYTGWYITGLDGCLTVFADPTAEKGRWHRIDVRIERVNEGAELKPVFMVKGWGSAIMVATDIAHQLKHIPIGGAGPFIWPSSRADIVLEALAWCYMSMEQRLIANMKWTYWAHPQRHNWTDSQIEIDAGGYWQRSGYSKILDIGQVGKELPHRRQREERASG